MRSALALAGWSDADEESILSKHRQVARAEISHTTLHAADELAQDIVERLVQRIASRGAFLRSRSRPARYERNHDDQQRTNTANKDLLHDFPLHSNRRPRSDFRRS